VKYTIVAAGASKSRIQLEISKACVQDKKLLHWIKHKNENIEI
jgi:hypothetical protein